MTGERGAMSVLILARLALTLVGVLAGALSAVNMFGLFR